MDRKQTYYTITDEAVDAIMRKAVPRLLDETPAFYDGLMERLLAALHDHTAEPRLLYRLAVNLHGLEEHRLKLISREKSEEIFAAAIRFCRNQGPFEVFPEANYHPRAFIDPRMREYIYDHGGRIDDKSGMIYISRKNIETMHRVSKSLADPDRLTLDLPTTNGSCLIFEGQHFTITED